MNDRTTSSDDNLILAWRNGDRRAFDLLVTRHSARLVGFIYHYLGDRFEAEDLAQETFVRIFRHVRDYTPGTGFAAWMLTIARNLSLDELKRRKRHPAEPAGTGADIDADHCSALNGTSAPGSGGDGVSAARVRALVAALPADKRELIVLRFYQGLTYHQIGRITGDSEAALRVQVHRLLKDLQDRLR